MIRSRCGVTALLLLLISSSVVLGANQVRVYVPANAFHAEQELVLGQPGEIFVEITNDVEMAAVQVVLGFDSPEGHAIWSPLEGSDFEFMLPEPQLPTGLTNLMSQDGVWPDTIDMAALKLGSGEDLPVGTHLMARFTVLPTLLGTIVLTDENHAANGPTKFVPTGGGEIFPEFLAENITVILLSDCNDNGIPDVQEIAEGTALDCNSNGLPDDCDITIGNELDCNLNGIPDACELSDGTVEDCNSNLIPDGCDPDLNFNGIPDDCEALADCNSNGVADADDIAIGFSDDVNTNGVPDECEGLAGNFFRVYVLPTYNHESQELVVGRTGRIMVAIINDVEVGTALLPISYSSGDGSPLWQPPGEPDGRYLNPGILSTFVTSRLGGDWPDTVVMLQIYGDLNPIPVGFHPIFELTVTPSAEGVVSWEAAPVAPVFEQPTFVVAGSSEAIVVGLHAPAIAILPLLDCNDNGVPDAEELASGAALDCNENGLIDECELTDGLVEDCNANGIPDECDQDLNANGIPDDCEVTVDCNDNGVPDDIDIAGSLSADTNANGVPDECEGLAGNFIRIFVPPNQELVIGRPAEIVIALANDVEIAGAAVLFRYLSGDGTPLWEPLVAGDAEFSDDVLYPGFLVERQNGVWPDTLIVLPAYLSDGSLPIGFHSICRLTVMPTVAGVATLEAVTILPSSEVVFIDVGSGSEFGVEIHAEPITVLESCCSGVVGNVNLIGGDEPTISDIATLIDHLFISGDDIGCLLEADVNQSGGYDPLPSDITISDVSFLIGYLFIDGGTLPSCH